MNTEVLDKVGDIRIIYIEAQKKFCIEQLKPTGVWHCFMVFGLKSANILEKIYSRAEAKGNRCTVKVK